MCNVLEVRRATCLCNARSTASSDFRLGAHMLAARSTKIIHTTSARLPSSGVFINAMRHISPNANNKTNNPQTSAVFPPPAGGNEAHAAHTMRMQISHVFIMRIRLGNEHRSVYRFIKSDAKHLTQMERRRGHA